MQHFAPHSGKSKGQFYTPSEVSCVIAKVVGISPGNTVASTAAYDPTCGSGSPLLKVAAESGKHITLEGQEKDMARVAQTLLHGAVTGLIERWEPTLGVRVRFVAILDQHLPHQQEARQELNELPLSDDLLEGPDSSPGSGTVAFAI